MLLGENGLGKSTILQAVALTLLDEGSRERLDLDAREWVRSGTRRASVKVHLTGTPQPIELIARRGSRHFDGGDSLKALLLGYGATRLLPTPAHPAIGPRPGESGRARVENLFDPFIPIGDATAWLLGLPDDRFDDVALGLRQLLMLGPEERLIRDRRNGRVLAEQAGTRVRLEHLSAGYQSVIALATDVMKVVLELWDTPAVAEGVVIVDELGAHLHPRWRMRIVEALRGIFPRVQFLASTHDPLCLRGLADGEVVVLRHGSDGNVVVLDDLPPATSMRIDQLLASEHFGLGSTVDPELDGLFAEYYLLKAKRRPNTREVVRIDALQGQLEDKRLLGTTRRERLIYEATDDYLAREVDVTDHSERARLKQATKERIQAAWRGSS
jgi:ABC-type sulfate/molybdate transport systems ATPase subunit